MALPRVEHPTFKIILPSTKQEVLFRPFLVKEEKILLVAQSSGDSADVVRAIRQVVTNCIVTPGIDVSSFTSFDLEYFFIKLRARSVNNIVKLSYKDREDDKIYEVEVDLDKIEVAGELTNADILLQDGQILRLTYPRISLLDRLESVEDSVDFNFAILASCLDSIIQGDEVIKINDHTQEEIEEFLNSLDVKTYEQIQRFVDNMPHIEHTVSYTNSNDKTVEIKLTTLTDFFTLG